MPDVSGCSGSGNVIEVAALSTEVKMAIAVHRLDPLAHPSLVGSDIRELLPITIAGQTAFTLSTIPTIPHLSRLFLNGVKALYAVDYSINEVQLNWLGVTLSDDDELEIFYR
jgi:hypothetical protein